MNTGWSIATGYKVNHSHRILCDPFLHRTGYRVNLSQIHNERVQGDHFFGPTFLDPGFFWHNFWWIYIFLNQKFSCTYKFVGPIIVLSQQILHHIIFGPNLVWDWKFFWDKKIILTRNYFWQQHFWTNVFWTNFFCKPKFLLYPKILWIFWT